MCFNYLTIVCPIVTFTTDSIASSHRLLYNSMRANKNKRKCDRMGAPLFIPEVRGEAGTDTSSSL